MKTAMGAAVTAWVLLLALALIAAACVGVEGQTGDGDSHIAEKFTPPPGFTPRPSPSPTVDLTPVPTPTPTPTPSLPSPPAPPATPTPLPSPSPGFTWWIAPPVSPSASQDAPWLRRYAVQLPADWGQQPSGPYLANPMTFSLEGAERTFPYAVVPQLTIVLGRFEANPPDTHAGWQHPWLWNVGRQGGGGCSGDVSDKSATPSGRVAAGGYTWDLFAFTCRQDHISYPPGPSYDGRAAEARIGDVVIGIVVFEPVGSGAMKAAFEQAMNSFTFR